MILATTMEPGLIFVLAGALAGLISGLLSVGGGVITVPALLYHFHHTQIIPPHLHMQVAAGTSLAIMIFTTQAATRANFNQDTILWDIFRRLWPGMVSGAIIGALLSDKLSTHLLKNLLGFVLLFILINMLFNLKKTYSNHFPRRMINDLMSFMIGLLSGLLGIGGGTLLIPYFTYCGVETRKISPLSNVCTLAIACFGTLAFMIAGLHQPGLPAYSTGYVYWPAVICIMIPIVLTASIGARLAHTLPIRQLKLAFAALLFFVIIHLVT